MTSQGPCWGESTKRCSRSALHLPDIGPGCAQRVTLPCQPLPAVPGHTGLQREPRSVFAGPQRLRPVGGATGLRSRLPRPPAGGGGRTAGGGAGRVVAAKPAPPCPPGAQWDTWGAASRDRAWASCPAACRGEEPPGG